MVFGLFLVYVFLSSCQSQMTLKQDRAFEQQRLNNAALYHVQLGIAYLKQGNRLRAKQKLLKALDLAPHLPEVNAAMGYFLEITGHISQAQSFYHKALALAPDSGSQLNNYGIFLCHRGRFQEAEHYFLKAVKDVYYLYSASAYENAGLCAEKIHDDKKALYYFKKALAEDPSNKHTIAEIVTLENKLNR